MSYNPNLMPPIVTVEELRKYVEDEFHRLSQSLNGQTSLDLSPVYREPLRPREGLVVYADGTSWNPGSGAGAYEYRSSAWHKL